MSHKAYDQYNDTNDQSGKICEGNKEGRKELEKSQQSTAVTATY